MRGEGTRSEVRRSMAELRAARSCTVLFQHGQRKGPTAAGSGSHRANNQFSGQSQMELSTDELILKLASPAALEIRLDPLSDHPIFVFRDVGNTRRPAEVEDGAYVTFLLGSAKIFLNEAAKIFRQGNSEIAGALAGAAVGLRLKRDLRARHHDGTVIP